MPPGSSPICARPASPRTWSGNPDIQDHFPEDGGGRQNAFHLLFERQDLEKALVETVGTGGYTDTNAAIAGALLGAVRGRDAIPLRWRRAVLSSRAVTSRSVHHPRPKDYWSDDAMELAEALLVTGVIS
jgi:hypothetical protein